MLSLLRSFFRKKEQTPEPAHNRFEYGYVLINLDGETIDEDYKVVLYNRLATFDDATKIFMSVDSNYLKFKLISDKPLRSWYEPK